MIDPRAAFLPSGNLGSNSFHWLRIVCAEFSSHIAGMAPCTGHAQSFLDETQ